MKISFVFDSKEQEEFFLSVAASTFPKEYSDFINGYPDKDATVETARLAFFERVSIMTLWNDFAAVSGENAKRDRIAGAEALKPVLP